MGDGPTTVDPVFRAIAHTGFARDLLLAESPTSAYALADRCPSAGVVILPEWRAHVSVGQGRRYAIRQHQLLSEK